MRKELAAFKLKQAQKKIVEAGANIASFLNDETPLPQASSVGGQASSSSGLESSVDASGLESSVGGMEVDSDATRKD